MKYTDTNPPLKCMMTNSSCYKRTRIMEIKGVLWHSTGCNNPNIYRYVQPSKNDSNYNILLTKIGKNPYCNSWNEVEVDAGLNAWIGKMADGTVSTVQTMPWNYRPWGCGGDCNSGWIQFEICEDNLNNKSYFNSVYKEACELTAYLCVKYKIDPKATVSFMGKQVPTILSHRGSCLLGLGSEHGDPDHWLVRYGKSMETVRDDVYNIIINTSSSPYLGAIGGIPVVEISKEVLSRKKEEVKNIIQKVTDAINAYNAGKGSLKSITYLQETYEKKISDFLDYLTEKKNKEDVTYVNINELEKIYESLKNATFPKIDELKRKQALGSNEWYDKFKEKYDQLVDDFYASLLTTISSLKTVLLEDLNQSSVLLEEFGLISNLNINKYLKNTSFIPTVFRPEKDTSGEMGYLWNKMFNYVDLSIIPKNKNTKNFTKNYTNTNKENYYNEMCYDSYVILLKHINTELSSASVKLNNALEKKDFDNIIQQYFNILQLQIYKLYTVTFGDIGRKKIDSDEKENTENKGKIEYEYTKNGICYNFGGENTDYQAFCKQKNNKIFSTYLYLQTLNLDAIIEDIKQLIISQRAALINKKRSALSIIEEEKSYKRELAKRREKLKTLTVDWRELIYQMAQDYYEYAHNNPDTASKYWDFMRQKNSNILNLTEEQLIEIGNEFRFRTNYEPFYTDLLGFWRQLYFNPILEDVNYSIENNTAGALSEIDFDPKTGWAKIVSTDPSRINFWIDLTKGQGDLSNYSISAIGDRLKASKSSDVTSIYYKDVPEIIFYEQEDLSKVARVENDSFNNYSYFQIGGPLLNAYTVSSQGRSALDVLQEYLYKFSYCVENVTITTLPIYTLKPNYRVMVQSHIAGLSGEYIVSKFSIPLTYNGTMSITATKAVPYIGINK